MKILISRFTQDLHNEIIKKTKGKILFAMCENESPRSVSKNRFNIDVRIKPIISKKEYENIIKKISDEFTNLFLKLNYDTLRSFEICSAEGYSFFKVNDEGLSIRGLEKRCFDNIGGIMFRFDICVEKPSILQKGVKNDVI